MRPCFLGIVNQLGATVGIFLSQVIGLPYLLGTGDGWPYLLGITMVPAIVQLLTLPLSPESPRYLLLTKKREEDARSGRFQPPPELGLVSILQFQP